MSSTNSCVFCNEILYEISFRFHLSEHLNLNLENETNYENENDSFSSNENNLDANELNSNYRQDELI